MAPTVSIIVPAYNAERVLPKCLNSLINQTLKNIEIIVVNDGSKDETLAVCKKYAQKDKRILVIDQENHGVAYTRNTGIARSSGQYIGFCDADDYVDVDMYRQLWEAAQQSADIAACGYRRDFLFFSRPHPLQYPVNQQLDQVYIRENMLPDLYYDRGVRTDGLCGICNKIYRREFVIKNEISFPIGWDHAEDANFSIQTLRKAQRMVILPEAMYHYIKPLNRKTLTSKPRPDFFALELRYRNFIRNTLGTDLNIDPASDQEYLLIISKAEKNAINLMRTEEDSAVTEKWLKFIFENCEYRDSLLMCSEEKLSEIQQKERRFIERGAYGQWVELMGNLAAGDQSNPAGRKGILRNLVEKILSGLGVK